MNRGEAQHTRELTQRLSEAEATIEALLSGQIDAVVGSRGETTLLLKAQDALRESEARFRQITDTIREVFFLTDTHMTRFFYVSPAYAHMFGRTCESLYLDPGSWGEAVHPDDRERALAEMAPQGTVVPFDVEYRIVRPDGSERSVWARGYPIYDDAGEIHRFAGIAEDVTERKTLEAQRADAERRTGLAVDAGQMGTFDLDLATDTSVRSLRHDQIFGYATPLREWGVKNLSACVLPEDLAAVHGAFEEASRTGVFGLECRIRWPDTTVHWISARGRVDRDAQGVAVRILGIVSDATERKRVDAERGALTERLSLATAAAKIGIWEYDLASHALTWDATMFELYDIPPNSPVPYDVWSAKVCPDDLPRVEATRQMVIREKSQATVDYRIIMTDGSVKHISSVERVKLDDDANVIGTLGVNVDVTVRTMAEQVVERGLQEHMRLKDEFLSHVSHELRSPLTAIKQFTSILAGGFAGALNEDQQKYQEIVLKNTRQLQAMIDDLLEITRLGTGKLTVNPDSMSLLDAVVDALNTIQGAARGKGITLSCDLPPDLPSAYADHTRIQQILIILLDNAIKFTPNAGAVHVRAERLREDARFLMLQVTDTGCGISQEVAANIFDRLYQVPASRAEGRKGLGLGLYICKELVSRQGGHIWVTPAPEGGTTFSITLPVFSLDTVLAPLFKQGRSPTEAMALVVVQMRFPDTWRGKDMQEVQSQELRKVLQRCLMPDLDVLLPSKRRDGEQVCFVAALADAQGAAVLVRRIRGQLEALLRPPEAGLSFTVSYRMLEPTPHEIGSSTDRLVQRLVSTVEEAMESHLLTEVASL